MAFPLISSGWTVSVKLAEPPVKLFVNVLFSMVPIAFIILEPLVSSVIVIFIDQARAKLLPEELAILRDVTVIGSASIIVMILLTLSPGFPALSASAVYV